jgi:hypothetical protein
MTKEEAFEHINGETNIAYSYSGMSWAEVDRRASAYFEAKGIVYALRKRIAERKKRLGHGSLPTV